MFDFMMMIYKSKSSPILKFLFAIVILVLLIFAIAEKKWALFFIILIFVFVVMYVFVETHYTIYEDTLTIKSGFLFNEDVAIESIKKITLKKKSLLSGPGFSIDRMIVHYGEHGCVIISPLLKEAFLDHLKRINPDIIIVK